MSNIKEQIRQEIDTRRQHMVEELMGHEENCEYHRIKGMHDAYVDLLTFLDYSLPEEKPSEDLEEEVKRYYSDNFTYISSDQPTLSILTNVARHFAEWQKERMMDEWLKDRDGCFWDGVEEGKKAMKEQMMKDAVEGDYDCQYMTPAVFLDKYLDGIKDGDKVRIIIVKED